MEERKEDACLMSDETDIYDKMDDAWMEEEEVSLAEAKRKAHNAYMKEYNKRLTLELKWMRSHSRLLAQEIVGSGREDELSDESRKYLHDILELWPRDFPPILKKLFGNDVAVGRSVTARECIEKIYKGRSEMRAVVNRWKKKGYVVEFELDPEGGPLDATYTIREIPIDKKSGLEISPEDFRHLK